MKRFSATRTRLHFVRRYQKLPERILYRSSLIAIFLVLTLAFALWADTHSPLQEERLARHRARSLSAANRLAVPFPESSSYQRTDVRIALDYQDSKIFDDSQDANFAQRYPDLAHFSDGSGIAVWEDERNGDWDIYAQLFATNGSLSGSDFDLLVDPWYRNQRQPRVAVDGADNFAVVWAEQEDGRIYASVFNKNLTTLASAVQLDDAAGGNATNLPAVAGFAAGGFVVVWEDARSGANIYAQLLSSTGTLQGLNFQVNQSVASPTRLAPAVATDDGSHFVVAWEDDRDGETDVMVRVFNSSGAAQTSDFKIADGAFESSYQFAGQLAFVTDGYFVAGWISDRNAEQGVYAQLFDAGGGFSGSNFQLNSTAADVCWDLALKPAGGGGTVACWANLSSLATIDFVFLGSDGVPGTSGEAQDQFVTGERGSPALCWSAGGGQAIWSDQRNLNHDIYMQQFDAAKALADDNVLVNADQQGSQQLQPAVAGLSNGKVAVVWREQLDDPGDIYFQLANLSGSAASSALRLNDDSYRAVQQAPALAASAGGNIVAVWEDSREVEGVPGKNIFGQRLNSSGSPSGANFRVNSDLEADANSEPVVALNSDGYYLVAFAKANGSGERIILQPYDPSGQKLGSNREIDSPVGSSVNHSPAVGLRDDASGVISWTSILGIRRAQYLQRLDPIGDPGGDPVLIGLDTLESQVLAADLFVHPDNGEYYVAVVDSQLSGVDIKLLRYEESSALLGGVVTVAANVGADVTDLCLTGDVDDALLVSWTAMDNGIRRGYLRLMHQFGYPLNQTSRISSDTGLETNPVTTMLNGQYFALWCDNRNGGNGFDLFANSTLYASAAADDDLAALPGEYTLAQNYPNPFNPGTIIEYYLGQSGPVKLEIFNLLGERIRTLTNRANVSGWGRVYWDGKSGEGESVASGVYFYRLSTKAGSLTRKMLLLK